MFRVPFVLLVVAGILACPFQCMAKFGAQGTSVEQLTECSCCQHRRNGTDESGFGNGPLKSDRHAPRHPEGCGCNCICKGAVERLQAPVADLEQQDAPAVWPHLALAVQMDTSALPLLSFDKGPPPPKLDSGRAIRLVLGSLLL